ncbi:MAG: lipid-A-disaccharide synthase [Leptothrix ochracea]|uniref:lipid-A-disaccharide synthase n=1 Tax=Leptothrix ochracea TaxID=735331 RepID=UPI0034E1CBA6
MTQDAPRLAMVAGETSGDLLAGLLLGGLRQRWAGLEAVGIGGPKMAAQGFQAWWPHDKLAVHGYAEALRHYREIAGIRRQLAERLLVHKPDLFIGVDAPDFNLGLEERLKAAGIPAIHFVGPSLWAWRAGRIDKMRRSTDHVLCLFPFEPEIYAKAGIPATYVGHPLADAIPLETPRVAARARLGYTPSERVIALLPGSRRGEMRHIAPRLLAAAALLVKQRPGLRFVLPVVPGLRSMFDALLTEHAPGVSIDVLDGRSHEALAACDLTLIASGTATLEAALFKRPMVIAYHMHFLSWQLMKRMRLQPWVGLPNILLRDFAVPELIQDAATPEALAREALRWLDDPAACARVSARFDDLHRLLRQDTARRATDAIAQILQR